MRGGETVGGVRRDAKGDPEGDGAAGTSRVLRQLVEGVALEELHDQVGQPLVLAEVRYAHDVRVIDARDDPRLVEEHHAKVGVVRLALENGLDGEQSLELGLRMEAREPDVRHSTFARWQSSSYRSSAVPRSTVMAVTGGPMQDSVQRLSRFFFRACGSTPARPTDAASAPQRDDAFVTQLAPM